MGSQEIKLSSLLLSTCLLISPIFISNNSFAECGKLHVTVEELPRGVVGSGTALISDAPPGVFPVENAEEAAFRTVCFFSHMNYDDPIVYPNQPGRAHLHTFFGNKLTNAYSTMDSLKSSGNSTCSGGILNRSAYWVPTMLTPTGVPIPPNQALIYYKQEWGSNVSLIQPLPDGLRMISGNHMATSPQNDRDVYWMCNERWTGKHPTIGATPCVPGETLVMRIIFPTCWNGQLDSADHKSHLTYRVNGSCPASHPTFLPQITMNVQWKIPNNDTSLSYRQWRLSSDSNSVNSGDGGISIHGDYFIGWDRTTVETWTKQCLNAKRDCHGELLGNGKILGYADTTPEQNPNPTNPTPTPKPDSLAPRSPTRLRLYP